MAKACIAIGIEHTEGLDPLPGAVRGAQAIANWAAKAGYETELLIDQDAAGKRRAVGIDAVCEAFLRLLPTPNDGRDRGGPADPPERLIVYFAGHGMQSGFGGDMWLLSDSYNDQRAIGVAQLQDMLMTYLPGQIAMISDACRSPNAQSRTVGINPLSILPLGAYDPGKFQQIDVDQFFAVPPRHSAYMINSIGGAAPRCIFTSVLLEALHGVGKDCFDAQGRVTSDRIALYLRKNVTARAQSFEVDMLPRSYACWLDPQNSYVTQGELAAMALPSLDPWPAPAAPVAPDDAVSGAAGESPIRGDKEKDRSEPVAAGAPPPLEALELRAQREVLTRKQAEVNARVADLETALARPDRATHYETNCGLTIAGGDVAYIHVPAGVSAVRDRNFPASWQVTLTQNDPASKRSELGASMLVETADGDMVGSLLLEGFFTDCILDDTGCIASSFRQTYLSPDFRLTSEEAIADMARGALDPEAALELAASMRNDKHKDPMLGVIAAYLYHAAGDIDSVRRMAWYYSRHSQPVPFDLALLARCETAPSPGGTLLLQVPIVEARAPRTPKEKQIKDLFGKTDAVEVPIVGSFPMMRAGWFMLPSAAASLAPSALAELASELRPAPFTTLTPEGGRKLRALIGA